MEVLGRDYFLQLEARRCFSLPYQLFIDGFGLYRNMYRSVMGIYLIPAGLSSAGRAKSCNLYTITLGPHGTNFEDVIASLTQLNDLDKGLSVDDGQYLLAFCLAFLGDMPQQADNAGVRRPTAMRSCRSCLVSEDERDNMLYGIDARSRGHYETLNIRKKMSSLPKRQRDDLSQDFGMSLSQTPLFRITPCLNLDSFFSSGRLYHIRDFAKRNGYSVCMISTVKSKRTGKQEDVTVPCGSRGGMTHLAAWRARSRGKAGRGIRAPHGYRCQKTGVRSS